MTNITFIKIPEQPVSKCYTDEFSFILKPSPIAGVGVFVTHKIKKGTRIRVFSGEPTRKMKMSEVKKNPVLAKFVEFFAVVSNGVAYMPPNFSRLDVGWYLNNLMLTTTKIIGIMLPVTLRKAKNLLLITTICNTFFF